MYVSKSVGDPFQLFDTSHASEIFKRNNRVLIGHNRYATTGKVTRKNAHPFEFDSLVGVHNGTLKNKWKLENGNKFDVDSQALYQEIEDFGLEEALGKAEGAWTLVWWDKNNKSFNMLRNEERPLSYILSEEGKTLFGASEAWMLTAVLNREQYKVQKIENLPVNMHYEWNIPLVSYADMPELDKPRVKKVEGKKEVAVVHQFPKAGWTPHQQNQSQLAARIGGAGSDNYLLKKQITFNAIKIKKDAHGNEYMDLLDKQNAQHDVRLYFAKSEMIRKSEGKLIIGDITGMGWEGGKSYYKVSPWSAEVITGLHIPRYAGNEISQQQFEENYHTCAWCSSSIQYGDECHIFDSTTGVLCEACLNDAEVNQYIKVV